MYKREDFLDSRGIPLTQALFLELGYTQFSKYTLKDIDHEWEGKTYPSLKKLYLELEDVAEYEFATTYLLGWKHWMRLCENKNIRVHIDEWRDELELKLRSRAAKKMMELAAADSYQAAKWLADRGWGTRGAGRPTKAEKAGFKAIAERVNDEYGADVVRLFAGGT